MKKLFTLFAVLVIAGMSMVQATPMDIMNATCTTDEFTPSNPEGNGWYTIVLVDQGGRYTATFMIKESALPADKKPAVGHVYTKSDMLCEAAYGKGDNPGGVCLDGSVSIYYETVSLVRDLYGGYDVSFDGTGHNSLHLYYDARITDPKDSVEVTCSTSDFSEYDNRFYFFGYTSDSSYQASMDFKVPFAAGSYNDSVLAMGNCYVINRGTGKQVYLANGLSDAVVTIDSTTGVTYYNLKYRFVGRDSVLYKLDMTYHKPYEKEYYEAVTTRLNLDQTSVGNNRLDFNFEDSCATPKYKYILTIPASMANETQFTINDSVMLMVVDYNDPEELLYMSYSGKFTLTQVNESIYTIVGQILCEGDMNFYFNCKHPTAVENVTVSELNVYSDAQAIILNGVESQNVAIYDINGRMVYNTVVKTDNARFAVPAGIYVVRVNDQATKIIVK